jgi:hypothetical protein
MNSRLYLFAVLMTMGSIYAFAQDETDVVRYSNLSPQGTARSMGFGGALGSIGGDFSALSVNPAGIGIYRSSEFTFTPSIKLNNTHSSYLGSTTDDNNTRFTINNLGVVFTNAQKGRRYERSKWKSVSFGLGIARVADFNRNYTYQGLNKESSATETFLADANYNPNGPGALSQMAYSAYLIDTVSFLNYRDQNGLYRTVANPLTGLQQQRIVKERGGITDINISLGGNYEEKLMLGATLGIPSLFYSRDVTFTESDATNDITNYFDHFTLNESLTTRGSGINLKLGFIYKANDNFRFGAAFHTPTYFQLKDIFNQSLVTNTEGFKNAIAVGGNPVTQVDAQENVFEYSLITPWKGVLSASALIGKYGFITADYEYINYATARFNYETPFGSEESSINQVIKSSLAGASNVRVGAEGRLDNFALRLGFGYYGSPYKNTEVMGSRTDISGGVGFRQNNWYLDLGFVHSQYDQKENPYVAVYPAPIGIIAPVASTKSNLNNMAVTIGFKF